MRARGILPLSRYIFDHYARSALIPILSIELLLIVIYFSVNLYTNRQAQAMLGRDVESIMPHLARMRAQLIGSDLQAIQRNCEFFAGENAALFADPSSRRVAGEAPRFAVAPSGALYQTNRTDRSSLFFSRASGLSPSQLEKARFTAALDPLYAYIVDEVPNVAAAYLNTYDDMNRLYPFIPEVYSQYPPDLHMEDYNFYYLADAAHDPGRGPVWTGVYLDPAGQGWMLSCVAPVYRGAFLEGVVGLDVTIAKIVDNILTLELPWNATAFLADQQGMILAMRPEAEEILGLKELKEHVYSSAISKEQLKPEEFNILLSRDPAIAESFKEIYASSRPVSVIDRKKSADLYVVGDQVEPTGWKLFFLIQKEEVLASVNAMARLSSRIGAALVVAMLGFYVAFFSLLRRRAVKMSASIAAPVSAIAAAAKSLGSGSERGELPASGIAELDALTASFAQMADELDARSEDLIRSEVRSMVKQKESELAFARGMFESASGYLHNVGNSVTGLDSSLLDLDAVLKSTEQYPQVFDRIVEGDRATLDRFRTVLLEKTVPRLRSIAGEIARIKDTIQRTIRHQQQSFKSARAAMSPEKFDLARLVRTAAAEAETGDERVALSLDLPESLEIVHYPNQLYNGIVNVVKNAAESCRQKGSGRVEVALRPSAEGAVLTVRDDGAGFGPELRGRMLSAGFTTKPEGNGFGLHSFAVFLSGCGGRISLDSPGPGLGATATIEVNHA
jgi:C4-dicarboxylate-specific signal transduction histidine kinase